MKRLLRLSEDENYIKFKDKFIKEHKEQFENLKYTLSILESDINNEPIVDEFKYLYNKTQFFDNITEEDLNRFLEQAKKFDEKMTGIFGIKD